MSAARLRLPSQRDRLGAVANVIDRLTSPFALRRALARGAQDEEAQGEVKPLKKLTLTLSLSPLARHRRRHHSDFGDSMRYKGMHFSVAF
jgi:hypothetical protein